MTSKLGHI